MLDALSPFITLPLVGLFVGYITNVVAIEMLFHPKRPWFIGRFKLPFTPGLIPLNRDKIEGNVSRRMTDVLLDAMAKKGDNDQIFSLFNAGITKFWLFDVFLPDEKRKEIFNKIMSSLLETKETRQTIARLLIDQIRKYDLDNFEASVRSIAGESFQGIKFLGGVIGGLTGLVVAIIGVMK